MSVCHKDMADEDLMLIYRDTGDDGAFEILYSRYSVRLTAFVGRYVEDPETARDLAQETFIRIAGSRGVYEAKAKFATWAYRIATNLAINAYRSARRRPCVSLNGPAGQGWSSADADEPELQDTIPDDSGGIGLNGIFVEETAREMREAIAGLPGVQREAFKAVVVDGLTYTKAAARYKCSVGTMKSRVHHARRSIRRMVEGEVAE